MEISPSLLRFNPEDNGRAFPYGDADLVDLLQDLEMGVGIREPVLVQSIDTDLWVVAGIRRTLAGRVWAETHPDYLLPIALVENLSPMDALILNIRENVARKELTIIDVGSDAARLRAGGKTGAEIKTILGLGSEGQVSQAIKLYTELPEYIQLLVHNKTISADDAFTLLKIDNIDKRQDVLNTYLEGKATAQLVEAKEAGENVSLDVINPDAETYPSRPPSNKKKETLRELAVEAGAPVGALRMPELKTYLKDALEMEGPGSHKGEVALKKALLEFLERAITAEDLTKKFERICKERF